MLCDSIIHAVHLHGKTIPKNPTSHVGWLWKCSLPQAMKLKGDASALRDKISQLETQIRGERVQMQRTVGQLQESIDQVRDDFQA